MWKMIFNESRTLLRPHSHSYIRTFTLIFCFRHFYFRPKLKLPYFLLRSNIFYCTVIQGGPKVTHQTEKIEYLHWGLNKRADFFVNDSDMFKHYIHNRMCMTNPLLSNSIDFNEKENLIFHIRKKQCTNKDRTVYSEKI